MKPLTLTLKRAPAWRVDLSPLTPDRLAGLTLSAIRKLNLDCGNQCVAVDDLFKVDGQDTSRIEIHRSSAKLVNVGADMTQGEVQVSGPVGDALGRGMHGGTIRIRGNAGHHIGTGMAGGLIEIRGNAGDLVGAARPGDIHGMNDGTILITGNAGMRLGDRMRRGTIIVKGNVGDYCGARMLAGTVVVLGTAGHFTGLGMRRGTIVLGRRPKHVNASFNGCGRLKMQFLRILFRHLARSHKSLAELNAHGPLCDRYCGDLSVGGKGELMILRAAYSY